MTTPSQKLFVRNATGLVRDFGARDVLLFASAMVFALVYTTVQFAWFYGETQGANLPLSLLVASIPFIFLMFTYWAISLVMPRTGSDYVWVSRIFSPSIGFVWSLIYMLMIFITGYVAQVTAFTYAFSISLSTGGLISGSQSLTNMGNFLSSGNGTFLLFIAFAIIFGAFSIFGNKLIKGLLYISWLAAIAGIGLMWYILGTTSNATFINHWNTMLSSLGSSAAYSAVQSQALAHGAASGITGTSGIVIALPLAALFLFGSNNVSAFAGEMKNIKKTVPIAVFVSLALGVLYWAVTSYLTLGTVGAHWMSQIGYGFENPSSGAYTLPFPPSQPLFLAVAAYPNTSLISVMFFTYLLGSIAPIFTFFWICTKYVFAWSFDRVVPTKLSDVIQRFSTPYVAIISLSILGVILSIPFVYYSWGSTFTFGSVIWGLCLIIPGIGLAIFPWVKKEMFASGPGFTSKKVGGFPVVSIFGILSALGFGYIGYIAFSNALYGNGAVGGLNTFTYELVAGILILGFAIYGISYYYHKAHGINIRLAFTEIPPE
ncbi:MAG TPA: APC family permease [Nitrososphaerales archaeon]|nr:APC family permease [Nitrososphaerales archaeon]